MFKKISFKDFTAFSGLKLSFSPGINVFIGENATGKTHIMKALYSSADITVSRTTHNLAEKINRVFLPSEDKIGRLVHRRVGKKKGSLEIERLSGQDTVKIGMIVSNAMTIPEKAILNGADVWVKHPLEAVYIPVKEMLSNAPGFQSEYREKKLAYEEIYNDIISKALKPIIRGPADERRKKLLKILKKCMDGTVYTKGEEFFLRNPQGNLEFTLLAEGYRKLGLLWTLIQNGSLAEGSVLFWDEPETNLNPKLLKTVIEILLELQRMGVQIFIATHNYVIVKWLDTLKEQNDNVIFHSLYRDEKSRDVLACSTDNYLTIENNPILEAFSELTKISAEKKMRGLNHGRSS